MARDELQQLGIQNLPVLDHWALDDVLVSEPDVAVVVDELGERAVVP